MCESVQNCCRICLDVETEHVSIIEDETIHLHIKSCLAMTVSANDNLPTDICVSCASQLSDFYSLKLNAMFSLEWLESCVQEKYKKSELKSQTVQPLPDSEYNSDSLLEFLNNTANIEEYLHNLGKEDIPSIVNMLDRNNENSMEAVNRAAKSLKTLTPKKKEVSTKVNSFKFNMEVDALDSDIEIVNEILRKEAEAEPKMPNKIDVQTKCKSTVQLPIPSKTNSATGIKDPTPSFTSTTKTQLIKNSPKIQIKLSNTQPNLVKIQPNCNSISPSNVSKCFACELVCNNVQKLSQHLSTCELAQRTCIQCNKLFDSRLKMLNHALSHSTGNETKCKCNKQFNSKEQLLEHQKTCQFEYTTMLHCVHRCKKCKETFNDRFKLYKHAKKHLLMAEKRICNICGHNFIGDTELMKHRKEVHEETSDSGVLYRCKVCSHTSSSHQELYIHVQTHLIKDVETELNLCDICGRCFKSCPLLLRHTITHKTVKKAKGELCNGINSNEINDSERNGNQILVKKLKGTADKTISNDTIKSFQCNGEATELNVKLNIAKINVKRDLFDVKSSFTNRNTTMKIPNQQNSKDNDVKCVNFCNGLNPLPKTSDNKICGETIENGEDLPEIMTIVTMCEKCGQRGSHLDQHVCV